MIDYWEMIGKLVLLGAPLASALEFGNDLNMKSGVHEHGAANSDTESENAQGRRPASLCDFEGA